MFSAATGYCSFVNHEAGWKATTTVARATPTSIAIASRRLMLFGSTAGDLSVSMSRGSTTRANSASQTAFRTASNASRLRPTNASCSNAEAVRLVRPSSQSPPRASR